KLRSKLKELHQQIRHTMIYVTHDQTEALTFADQVVVMDLGQVVQIGTPVELFERPAHTFVGHFIGSPGMNVLPCDVSNGAVSVQGHTLAVDGEVDSTSSGRLEIGVRPEFVSLADTGLEARVHRVSDVGRHAVVEAMVGEQRVAAIHSGEIPNQGDTVHLHFQPNQTRVYADGWLAMKEAAL
ncbi:MAG: TOBE domain-containing protein, partial [Pseudomonadota bacterium]